MQTHLLAGVYFSFACWLCAAALLSFAAHLSGRRNADYLLFALLSIVLGVHAVGTGVAYLNGDGTNLARWAAGTTLAQAASVVAAALHLHFAIRYAAIPRQLTLSVAAYAIAGVLEYLVLRGDWSRAASAALVQLDTMGLQITMTSAPLDASAFAFLVATPLAHFGSCLLIGKAYLSGRRDGLAVFVGAGVLSVTAANDALVACGALRGLSLLPVGFTAFIAALAIAFVHRYADARVEIRRQSRELAEHSSKLRKNRRLLREMQSELGRKEQLAAIGEMAAVIAHEVRNPLAVISNAVASLRRNGLSRHDHDVLLTILDEEAVRLNRLVSDLLSYARPINL
ncbi:MAG: hypothetical protein MUF54_09880, partial [Polyangiaceae bacterium]|nr:hypothetical protein [Polyangiaceae bacterium]